MKVYSVDVGYGFVKAAAKDTFRGIELITFPSAVMADHSSGDLGQFFGNKHMRHRLTLTRNGVEERLLIGEAALAGGGRRYWNTSAGERMGYDALVLGALRQLGASGDVHVALGLPLAVFTRKEERRALVDSVKGLRSRVRVDEGVPADIYIAGASVYPQGVGALLHQYSLEGPEGRIKPVGVIDVGYKTVDFLLVLPGANGVVVPDTVRSGSVTMGMGHAIDQVREYVRSETGVSSLPPEGLVQAAVRGDGVLSVRGGSINIRDAYENACKSLALAITSEIERVWKEQMDYLAAIYLTGGGGADLAGHLEMPGVRVMDEPVFANALGFLSIASATRGRS